MMPRIRARKTGNPSLFFCRFFSFSFLNIGSGAYRVGPSLGKGSGWQEESASLRRSRRVEMMLSLTDSQTRSSSVARRPMAPIGLSVGLRMAECIAQCLNLEHELRHPASELCILGFEPLE
jgi:hypothetical protein